VRRAAVFGHLAELADVATVARQSSPSVHVKIPVYVLHSQSMLVWDSAGVKNGVFSCAETATARLPYEQQSLRNCKRRRRNFSLVLLHTAAKMLGAVADDCQDVGADCKKSGDCCGDLLCLETQASASAKRPLVCLGAAPQRASSNPQVCTSGGCALPEFVRSGSWDMQADVPASLRPVADHACCDLVKSVLSHWWYVHATLLLSVCARLQCCCYTQVCSVPYVPIRTLSEKETAPNHASPADSLTPCSLRAS
jgi:hypothetical protein